MPRKHFTCGIYCIETPRGSRYIGSSTKIEQRRSEHFSALRYGKHRSRRLQMAYAKYGDRLRLWVVAECDPDQLNEFEQAYILLFGAALNTMMFIENAWSNPDTAAKMRAAMSTPEWKATRRLIASRPKRTSRRIVASDGREFASMAIASRALGTRTAHIQYCCKSQCLGRLGVRLRYADEPWVERQRKRWSHTPEARAKMSAAAKARCARDIAWAKSRRVAA